MPSYPDLPDQRFFICPDRYDSDKDIDLSEKAQLEGAGLNFPPLYLLDGYVHNPPEMKTYVIDIPGRNTKLDVTEQVYGDVQYENRQNEYEFAMLLMDDDYPEEKDDKPHPTYMLETRSRFEYYKTLIYSYLHGKSFYYCVNDIQDDWKFRYTDFFGGYIRDTLWRDLMAESETWRLWIDGAKANSTWRDIWEIKVEGKYQKNYDSRVFHGRFKVSSFEREHYGNGDLGRFKLTVETDPYILFRNWYPVKFTKDITLIDESGTPYENPKSLLGGCEYNIFRTYELETDNVMPTRPVFITPQDLHLIFKNKRYFLPKGRYAIRDFVLTRKDPSFYLHAYPLRSMKWYEYVRGVEPEPRPIAAGKYEGQKITWAIFKMHKLYWWNRYHGYVEPGPGPTPGKHPTVWDEMISDSETWDHWTDTTTQWDAVWERDDPSKRLKETDPMKVGYIDDYEVVDADPEYGDPSNDARLATWGNYTYEHWFYEKDKTWHQMAYLITPDDIQDVVIHFERGCL